MRMIILLGLIGTLVLAQAPVFEYPIPFGPTAATYAAGTPVYADFPLNYTDDVIESYILMPFPMTITSIVYRVTAVPLPGPTYRISLQGVTADGTPDGTIKSGGNAYCNVTPTDAGLYTCNLVAPYTASKDEQLAIVIHYYSGAIGGSNYAAFAYAVNYSPITNRHDVTRTATVDAGTRTRHAHTPATSLRNANGQLYPGYITFDNSISYRDTYEAGLSFLIPCSMASSLKVRGVEFVATPQASGTLTVKIYDSGGTQIASVSRLHAHFGTASSTGYGMHSVWFPSDVPIRCGERYTVGITSSLTTLSYLVGWDATNSPWIPWRGVWWMRRRPVGGTWTDYPNLVPWAHLLVYQASVTGGFSVVSY